MRRAAIAALLAASLKTLQDVVNVMASLLPSAKVDSRATMGGRGFGQLLAGAAMAGVGSRNNVEDMSVDEWSSTIETNLSGVFYCCHEAIPLMKQRGGVKQESVPLLLARVRELAQVP